MGDFIPVLRALLET